MLVVVRRLIGLARVPLLSSVRVRWDCNMLCNFVRDERFRVSVVESLLTQMKTVLVRSISLVALIL